MNATYATALAAAKDSGNRHMKKAGRTAWNESDWNAACQTLNALFCPNGKETTQ